MSLRSLLLALVAALAVSAIPTNARADDRYYMMVFGQQSEPSLVRNSHTFAVFVKANGKSLTDKIETQCISWLSADMLIEPLNRDPEPGVNLTLEQSLAQARSVNARVSMWGPYPIKKDLYDMAAAQVDKLKSGKIQYLLLDTKWRGKGASNCIHAVADLDHTQAKLNSGAAFGDAASEMVVSHFESYILKSRESNRWLVDRLGLTEGMVRFMDKDLVAAR